MPAVDRIELDKTDLTLEIGDAIRLYPTLYPSGATGKIVWSSSDDYVAVVNSSGLVVARNGGIAYISVSMTDNLSISDVCRVTVNKSPTANESVPVDDLEVKGIGRFYHDQCDYAARLLYLCIKWRNNKSRKTYGRREYYLCFKRNIYC